MAKADKWRYGIVLDAGSSGTRIYIYRWLEHERAVQDSSTLRRLPEIIGKDKWTKKVHVGLSTYGETPSLIGTDHLEPLIKHALKHVPKELVPETPIFLLATAGMRLLPEHQQTSVLNSVCTYIQEETDFLLPDCSLHVQIIPGETEGLYGWIATNYLLGGFDAPSDHDHGKGHHTYGFLDMGGASSQIAFAPNSTEAAKHADDLKLLRLRKMDGTHEEHRVFVTTWLGFGVNEARRRYVEELSKAYKSDTVFEYPDPCLPGGVKLSMDSHDILDPPKAREGHLIGTGDFDACLKSTHPLLRLDVPCPDEPCLINGQHVPLIDFDVNHFIGISQYWHTTHEIFEMGYDDKAYDFATYQARVREFCSQDWSTIEDALEEHKYGKKVDQHTASDVCFRASWLINMLHDGIGIPRVGLEASHDPSGTNGTTSDRHSTYLDPFQAVDTIKSTEVSWTIGKILLYASSTIPPADAPPDSLPNEPQDPYPVGFGTNEGVPIPSDFVYPSIHSPPTTKDSSSSSSTSQSLTNKFSSTLFSSDSSHRLPGFIFFLLILVILAFYLCGRERRARFVSNIFRTSPRLSNTSFRKASTTSQPSSLLGRLLNRTKYSRLPAAEHDLEATGGVASGLLSDPSNFELHSLPESSSDSEDSAHNTGAGRISPRRSFKPKPTKNTLDRAGLVVRTESRERLDLSHSSSKDRSSSRAASPSRSSTAKGKGRNQGPGLAGLGRFED